MSVAVAESSLLPNGQYHEPVLVLAVGVLAATISPAPSELQAATKQAHAARIRIRIE
jgi:hypothetical protein